jgi:hypothetical protein
MKTANEILNTEFVKEIIIEHFPSIQRKILFKIGEEENISHHPQKIKDGITSGSFKKYFIIRIHKGIKIRIADWMPIINGFKDRIVFSIPEEELMGTAIIRKENNLPNYQTSLIIPCFDLYPVFVTKEDIFDKYKKYAEK